MYSKLSHLSGKVSNDTQLARNATTTPLLAPTNAGSFSGGANLGISCWGSEQPVSDVKIAVHSSARTILPRLPDWRDYSM